MYDIEEKCKLKKAIENGDLETTKELLQAFLPIGGLGKSPKRPRRHADFIQLTHLEKYSLLEKAIDSNQKEIFKFLLADFGLNNYEIPGRRTPLIHLAARNASSEIVKMLIERGFDINELGEHGYTALHEAVKSKVTEVVELILDHGADVDSMSIFGSPLHFAIRMDNLELVKLLLQEGADLNLKGNYCQLTPLEEAIKQGKTEVLRAILDSGIDISQGITEDMRKPLVYAAACGNESIVKLLVDRGFDVNVSERTGNMNSLYFEEYLKTYFVFFSCKNR